MIAPNSVAFRTDPQRSVDDAFVKNVAQNGPSGASLTSVGDDPAEDAEQQRVDVEQAGDEHQREEARDDEVLDRVDAEHLQRVELLADLARAEVGGDRRAGHAGEHDRGHERRELADRREHEEAAEAVERAEQDEEVRRLQTRRRRSRTRPSRSSSGNQHSRSANRNCETNSPPYGYGGRTADTIVFPVRIIMSPTSSKNPLAGAVTRSAALRTTPSSSPSQRRRGRRAPPRLAEHYVTARIRRKHLPSLARSQSVGAVACRCLW